jgi:hypothetical protein
MMRTIEVLLVIIIITGASIMASWFALLPQPQQVSPINLRRLALSTLEMLDSDHDLSKTVFTATNDPSWGQLQTALSASLPPNIVYNLTVYDESTGGAQSNNTVWSISNAASLGITSDAASYLVASSNVTFSAIPEKIGEHGGGGTLYILNCSDSNGWWITGYTSATLASGLFNLLSPYFQTTIMVQNTTQLGQILNGTKISGSPNENVTGAVVINTNGEAVPIPSGYYATAGYDTVHNSYAEYCCMLGNATLYYNWTWVSIVGYPLYYVCNTGLFPSSQNGWGIYGMVQVGAAGLNAFFEGLNNQTYAYNNTWITGDSSSDPGLANVWLTSNATYYCNYYGIYPSPYQTATRALPVSILNQYNLTVTFYVLQEVDNLWLPGAFYSHHGSGSFLAFGLARTPDIRLTALGLLCGYQPRLYPSQYSATGTSRLVILQLGQVGGV